jgi:acetolactate synthase-1/2/3 large subunit
MTGAEYIAEFLAANDLRDVFLVTGGACAFAIDAVARHKALRYICFQHEQAAAMAADAVWRVTGRPGVTIATSGPGATNLLTGIGCSYFDSIPSLHLTGQVNQNESASYLGAKPRQAGFQETDIVSIARPLTKDAFQIDSVDRLPVELARALETATSGRMGPVLVDIPMNVQTSQMPNAEVAVRKKRSLKQPLNAVDPSLVEKLNRLFASSSRPLVLLGGGLGLSGATEAVVRWLEEVKVPFVSSWSGMTYFNHDHPMYCGPIGVYGNRGANYIVQNCDLLIALGSRLDNRQRSGNSHSFAPLAKVCVVDIDAEELKKYATNKYDTAEMDLWSFGNVVAALTRPRVSVEWERYVCAIKTRYFGRDLSTFAAANGSLSPYELVQRANALMDRDAIVISDTGANLCWVYQVFHRTQQTLFTAAGNSPMGYALPAAIGAALVDPGRQVICFIGDGGFQLNLQELQTVVHYRLPIKIVLLNNRGYGIIKQFQDSYCESRHEASGQGYSVPDFRRVAHAYGLDYHAVSSSDMLTAAMLQGPNPCLIDVNLHADTLIEPRLEMGRAIHDQFPYVSDEDFSAANPFLEDAGIRRAG